MASWLDIVDGPSGWTLVDTGRLETLLQSMSHPKTQFPVLIHFAGNNNRVKALRALFPRNNVTRKGPASFARLHVSTETASTQYPVLFAESRMGGSTDPSGTTSYWHSNPNVERYPLPADCSKLNVYRDVMSQIILPWAHILCLFIDSHTEMQECFKLLSQPFRRIQVGSHSISQFMRVIFIFTSPRNYDFLGDVMSSHQDPAYTYLNLQDRSELSPEARYEPLRNLLLDKLQTIRAEQSEHGLSLSATHMCFLWKKSLQSKLEKLEIGPLNCLHIAREGFPKESSKAPYLAEFLKVALAGQHDVRKIYEFIASAFLMNAYPPDMHRFDPLYVFEELYKDDFTAALEKRADLETDSCCDAVKAEFTRLFTMMNPARSSAGIRREVLNRFFNEREGLYSLTACLFCMSKVPEHVLPCRHAICDDCIVIFGSKSAAAEYHHNITQCPMCITRFQFSVRLLPPTKGPNLLSLDGGGIRGILQLGLLRVLEKRLGGSIPIWSIFDLCTGTSVGALNTIDLILNKYSATKTFERFPSLAQKVFNLPSSPFRTMKCLAWVSILKDLILDGRYDEEVLEHTLKDAIGSDRRIFDGSTTHGGGSRVAIITSRISDGKACVLANYQGTGRHPGNESSYEFLSPQSWEENPPLWKVARCSVAAPWFFQTKNLPGFGPLQDGGVRANNPLSIALGEAVVIWPTKTRHDLLVSVGTGYTRPEGSDGNPLIRGILKDGAISRMIRAMMSSPAMDGEQAYLEALNYVPDHMRSNIYRLNLPLSGPLPRLDDVGKLIELGRSSFEVPDTLVRAILVTGLFFFELDENPKAEEGSIHCRGSVLCASPQPRKAVERVCAEVPHAEIRMQGKCSLGSIEESHICSMCNYYRKVISFTVKSLDEVFTLEVVNSSFQQKIGGFPTSVKRLLRQQHAGNYFGRVDHLSGTWPPERKCFCSRGSKRRIEIVEPPAEYKKRRL
ncbi:hypothetical protein N7478_000657 [Penicillium angulare]|uniref:uncharacterized protein n=1 Tax=Penicillium angulare TaxID=116970 RepID=UPI0025401F9E|nr:uncharacterized protein N7478_000657 [Penicillium angulare]KAJ5291406.1 hypothetical protein N7478_000657 [Penicillium angulare]